MEMNDTEIVNQISQLKNRKVKNLILMAAQQHLERYVTLGKNEMEAKTFNWYLITKVSK